jgi:hypothetical protein
VKPCGDGWRLELRDGINVIVSNSTLQAALAGHFAAGRKGAA